MALKEFSLDGRVALVTGSARGIGRGIAQTLADAGADVACVDTRMEQLEETTQSITSMGRRALAITADVTQQEQVESAAKQTLDSMGQVDILVNNAGVVIRNPVAALPSEDAEKVKQSRGSFFNNTAMSLEDWHSVLDVSLTGAFLFCRALGPHFIERRKGKVINTSSTAGVRGFPFITSYSAAKAGVALFTKALAKEWAPFNIQVNAIGPHEIPTDMNAHSRRDEEATKRTLQAIPVGHFGSVREVGLLVVYLASDASNYMTGQCVFLDGGFLA